MTMETIVSCVGILCGAIIMFVSIVKAKGVLAVTPLVAERHRRRIVWLLRLHRALMVFFLFGYIVVMLSFWFSFPLVGQAFVSVIFLFGAVFVMMWIMVQARLLSEVQSTLRGLLPICLGCKKIRIEDADSMDQRSWKVLEEYISERASVDFSHGYCPDCYEQELRHVKALRKKKAAQNKE